MQIYDLTEEKPNQNANAPCRDYDEDCHDMDNKSCTACWLHCTEAGICVMLKQGENDDVKM